MLENEKKKDVLGSNDGSELSVRTPMKKTTCTRETWYRSVLYRARKIKRVQSIGVFEDFRLDPESSLLWFHAKPRLKPHLKVTKIYSRTETWTWVWKVTDPSGTLPSVVVKLFLIKPSAAQEESEGKSKNYQAEVRFLRLFSYMARNLVSPHVVLPVGHTVFAAEEVRKSLVPTENVPDGDYAIIVSEMAEASFFDLIVQGKVSRYGLKALVFQVVFTLAAIQTVFPSFRHNDLHLSNVLVQTVKCPDKTSDLRFDRYQIRPTAKQAFINLNKCGYRALLWDMHFSSISEDDAARFDLQNDFTVPEKWVRSRHSKNQYVDVHKFFDSLEYALQQGQNKKHKYTEVLEIIDSVVPENLKCRARNRTQDEKRKMKLWKHHVVKPMELLQHKYFDELYRLPSTIATANQQWRCMQSYGANSETEITT